MFATRRFPRLIALSVVFALAACGGGDSGATGDTGEAGGEAGAAPAAVADAGTINGTINFTGTAPANEAIDMSAEPTCAAAHPSGPTTETVIANNGRLANVFVYLKEGLASAPAAPSTNVEIDQLGCVYHPHVTGVQVGQGVVFKNSDGLAHNVNAQPQNNRPFNISQPTSMTSAPQRFNTAEIMIPVQCDVHGWMQSYIGVVSNPYFATSGQDGTFTIGNVPPGTYTLEAWHERYGVKTAQVTVDPNGTATVTFDYDAAAVASAVVPLGEPFDPHTDVASERRVAEPATR
jgi:plastocyanin